MSTKVKYSKPVSVRFPDEVWKAVIKRTEHKQKIFGKYREADVIRTAVVNHLKKKGYLEKGKDYL